MPYVMYFMLKSIALFTGMAVEKEDVLRQMRFRFSNERETLNQIFLFFFSSLL